MQSLGRDIGSEVEPCNLGFSVKPREVILHICDVTNSESERTNSTIVQINKIFKDGIGLGGVFHSAVQVYGEDEWSFGFCDQGWVNRFANAGDSAMEVAENTAIRLRQARQIVSASKLAYQFLLGVTCNVKKLFRRHKQFKQ